MNLETYNYLELKSRINLHLSIGLDINWCGPLFCFLLEIAPKILKLGGNLKSLNQIFLDLALNGINPYSTLYRSFK